MKTLVRRSTAIVTFLGLLGLALTLPQMRHLERFADLLVVAPRRKTLAQLALQELDGVDPSNLANFFRISPWEPDDVRLPLIRFILAYLLKHRPRHDSPIYFTLDDSLTHKDKGTHQLQGVDWHFDHNSQRTVKGGCPIVLRIHWGDFHFPLTWRFYLRQSTVRRLNRDKRRRHKPRLHYRSKLQLAQAILTRYRLRWRQEVDYWHVKLQLGLGDFRLQSYEAIAKWYAVVYVVLVYLYWHGYEQCGVGKASMGLSEVLARMRQEHQREVLRAACAEVTNGASLEDVVTRYAGPANVPAA